MKATKWYFPVVLFIMLNKVVLTFESVNEILKCDHSNESYWAALSCGTFYNAVQDGSNFWSLWMKSSSVAIQMKANEQYFPVVLFMMLYKVVLTFESVDEILSVTILQMKDTEQYFPVVLFMMLYKVVPTFESVDEILKCGHSANESYWAVLSCCAVYNAAQGDSNYEGWPLSQDFHEKKLNFYLFQSQPYLNILSLCFVIEDI